LRGAFIVSNVEDSVADDRASVIAEDADKPSATLSSNQTKVQEDKSFC
jgi:hypothetical protein